MTDTPETKAAEDFLKAVFSLQQHLKTSDERVSTNALTEVLKIKPPSVTDMAQRLVKAQLIDYEKYRGVRLTATGQAIALKMIRRHRLIELYLVQELGYALHEVHEEAEKLEHAVSDRFIEAIALKMQHPQFDPHGDPIPAPDGTMAKRELLSLAEVPLATPARIAQFIAETPAMLQYTLDRGFVLHEQVQVVARDPFEGPVTVQLLAQQIIVGHTIAAAILVEVLN
jgi:DtxR family Mn-dependent transcriptional regulator